MMMEFRDKPWTHRSLVSQLKDYGSSAHDDAKAGRSSEIENDTLYLLGTLLNAAAEKVESLEGQIKEEIAEKDTLKSRVKYLSKRNVRLNAQVSEARRAARREAQEVDRLEDEVESLEGQIKRNEARSIDPDFADALAQEVDLLEDEVEFQKEMKEVYRNAFIKLWEANNMGGGL